MCKKMDNKKDVKNKDTVNELLDMVSAIDKSCNKNKAKCICACIITALFPIALIILASVFLFCECPPDTVKGGLCLAFVAMLLTACVIMFIKFLKHLDKLAEQNAKYNERLTDEVIRIYKEEKEHERLAEKTRVGLLEKQGKAIIDEETRAKEHLRKLEVMDKERIADFSDKVLDIAKVQVSNKTLDEKRAQQWISELIHTISNLSSKK